MLHQPGVWSQVAKIFDPFTFASCGDHNPRPRAKTPDGLTPVGGFLRVKVEGRTAPLVSSLTLGEVYFGRLPPVF